MKALMLVPGPQGRTHWIRCQITMYTPSGTLSQSICWHIIGGRDLENQEENWQRQWQEHEHSTQTASRAQY